MNRIIVLTCGGEPQIIEKSVDIFEHPSPYYAARHILGTEYVELVRPVGFLGKYGFYIIERGILENLPVNYYGSALYGTEEHYQPIAGDAVVIKLGNSTALETDWLHEKDIPEVVRLVNASEMRFREGLRGIFDRYKREGE